MRVKIHNLEVYIVIDVLAGNSPVPTNTQDIDTLGRQLRKFLRLPRNLQAQPTCFQEKMTRFKTRYQWS